jgi:EAL domain-containing protein (putative c-di-GMP-specific phosphodiesterase class I)
MAVDDFGTGYSSLSQLKRLNVSCLKVDQSLTAQLCTGTDDEAFFRGIVSMAHAINISVVAEGVETMEQLLILQQLSCDEVQGYFISRPVPAADVPHLIRRRFFYPLH